MPAGDPPHEDRRPSADAEARERLRLRRGHRVGLLLGLTGLLLAAMLLPELPNVRYAARYRGLAQPIFCEDGVLDVAFIGTSRMAWGVDAHEVAASYRDLTGEDVSIVDLSRVGPTEIVFEALLDELLENRRVRLVIVEFNAARLSDKYWSFITKVGNVLGGRDLYRQIDRIPKRMPVEQIGYFLSVRLRFLEAALGGLWLGCDDALGGRGVYDETQSLTKKPEFEDLVRQAKKVRGKAFPSDRLLSPQNHLSVGVAEKLAAKARQHDVEILFVNFNNMFVDQVSESAKRRFRRHMGAELATWPAAIDKTLKSEYLYMDKHHLDQYGAKLVAPWFAEKISQYLHYER
ncbi:hypothetical protein [Microbaculum marinum]|uniref:SGNH/GDSL hydrolase family protein n=1 Tax=Microbaculum marinum TaxID=1764581 RepID=A0AAW9RJH6_9HYPH